MAAEEQPDKLYAMRHSLAHITATAVQHLWPEAKFGVGPVVENGFYYDIDIPGVKISEEDLGKIEDEMRKVIAAKQSFERSEKPIGEAIMWAEEAKQTYKQELLNDLQRAGTTVAKDLNAEELGSLTDDPSKVDVVSFYTNGDFTDLCRGPHAESTDKVGAFKLLRVSGAYWRGNDKNAQMQRVYGVGFATEKELRVHLDMLEEAKKRDHRKLGQELELYFIDDEMVGKGLIMWLPKGTAVRDQIEALAREKEFNYGYQRVVSPHIAKEKLFLTSGHLPYYQDDMYPPMVMDDGTYYLKAMNCPHHHRIFQFRPRSYRELPLRFAEYGTCYRNELSGTLAGLLRVRALAMNDAHIYCAKEQVKEEFARVLQLTKEYFDLFGLTDYWFRLSKWDPDHTEKYINEPENWDYTQTILREVLEELQLPFKEVDDEAAFYGPKVDVQFKSVIGREETMSTIQLDFAAKRRFGLTYIDAEGKENNEVFVIHRAPLSVHERFLAFLIEHYAGKFPVWLAPEQVRIITVNQEPSTVVFAEDMLKQAKEQGIRAEIDNSNESVGKKIRAAEVMKVPYSVVIGEKEIAGGPLMPRVRKDLEASEGAKSLPLDEFLAKVAEEAKCRTAKSTI
jgi:threonyl-tRNA synthetase